MRLFKFKKKEIPREICSPMDLWYMDQMRRGLTSVDSWPYKALGEKAPWLFPMFHHKSLLTIWSIIWVSQVTYIRINYSRIPFFQLGSCIINSTINAVDNQRITMIMTKSYQDVTREFVQEIHLFHHKHKSEYSMKVYNRVNRFCTIICKYLYMQMAFAVVFFNLMPVVINVRAGMFSSEKNVTFIHGVYYALPFDYITRIPGCIFVYIMNLSTSCWVGVCFTFFDFYLACLVGQVWGHLDNIMHELKTMPLPSEGSSIWYSPRESDEVAEILKRNIRLHSTVVSFINRASIAFGPMLATSFFFYQIGCCILLLECSVVDSMALSKYSLTIAVYLQLINFSILFEFLGTKSEKLIDAVYGIPWESMGVRERKLVQVFLMKVQTPIRMKAVGLVPVGVNTMASIIKTSISTFVMLKTFAE